MRNLFFIGFLNALLGISYVIGADRPSIKSERLNFCVEEVAADIMIPWSLVFISNSEVLVGDKEQGLLHRINVNSDETAALTGLPDMLRDRQISSGYLM